MSSSFSSSFSSSTRRYRPGVSSGFSSSRRNEPSYTDRHSPRYISQQVRERMDQQWQRIGQQRFQLRQNYESKLMILVLILTWMWNYHASPFLSDVKLLNRIDRFTWKTSNLYDNSVYMKRVRQEIRWRLQGLLELKPSA